MKAKIWMLTGFSLIVLAGVWRLGIAPRWLQRIPPGWTWQSQFLGTLGWADPSTGQFPAKDPSNLYLRTIRIVEETDRPRAVVLESAFSIFDPADKNLKTWEYISRETVDPVTGAHVAPEHRGEYSVFPRHVERKTYVLTNNYLKSIPLSFKRQEELAGVDTYLFAYKGPAEFTESYSGSPDYPGVKVKPGQDIRCEEDQFVYRTWVEPVTGEVLKIEESCFSGDTVYEIAAGKKIHSIVRWGGASTADDLIIPAMQILKMRARFLWIAYYMPGLLMLAGLASLGLGVVARRAHEVQEISAEVRLA